MTYPRILGTGGFVPETVLTNQDLEQRIDTTADWIVERSGVEERRIAAPGQTTADLAEQACRRALIAADLPASAIDLIIVGTTTPDHIFPSVATQLQARLGCPGGPAFDVQAVCTGFVYALDIATRFLRTGGARHVLVVGADTFSRILNWEDRGTCILFGDGAGAVVLGMSETPGIIDTRLHADGRHKELLWVPAGVSSGYDATRQHTAFVEMRGNEVFKHAVNMFKEASEEILTANQWTIADVDWLVPHQANRRILSATAKRLGIPSERIVDCVRFHGNTSAASIPLALDVAVRDGRVQRGHRLLLVGFGGGFTWGTALLKY